MNFYDCEEKINPKSTYKVARLFTIMLRISEWLKFAKQICKKKENETSADCVDKKGHTFLYVIHKLPHFSAHVYSCISQSIIFDGRIVSLWLWMSSINLLTVGRYVST